MSGLHVYVLVCDAPACATRFVGEHAQLAPTRVQAALEGWAHHRIMIEGAGGPAPSVDLCAAHHDVDPYTCVATARARRARL